MFPRSASHLSSTSDSFDGVELSTLDNSQKSTTGDSESGITNEAKQPLRKRLVNSFKKSEGDDIPQLSHELGNFQLQMIAIGGAIGTGLFIGSGEALAKGGPASLVICFPLIGTMIWMMCQAAAELAVILPVVGSFSYYASEFIDDSWGFAMGVNYAMQWLILLPLELSAATMTFKFWPNFVIPDAALISIFFALIIGINLMSVKIYGWFEAAFSMCKVIAVVVFIILGICLSAGANKSIEYVGNRYWIDPGSFLNGAKGVFSTLLTAAFSFAGTELTALAACESKDVRKQIPKATKQVFWRILFIYLVCLTLIGFLVPFNDPALFGRGESDANSSPFVIAIKNGGIKVLPSIMNVIILISILSVGNSAIYASSRTLVFLAKQELIPSGKWFNLGFIDRKGRPMVANLFTLAFGCLAYISCLSPTGAEKMFVWLLALSGLSSLFTWGTTCLCHIIFRKALKLQNRSLDELPYKAMLGVVGSYYGLIINILILGIQCWIAASPIGEKPSLVGFLQRYMAFPFVILLFWSHKVFIRIKRGHWCFNKQLRAMDLDSGRRETDKELLIARVVLEEELLRLKPWYKRWYKTWC